MNIAIGIIFTCAGILVAILEIKKQLICTELTTGKVVDISREVRDNTDTGREIVLYPIYEYVVEGNTITAKYDRSVNGAFIGQTVDIHYNPDKPNEFYTGKLGNIIQIIGGIIFVVAGITVMLMKM